MTMHGSPVAVAGGTFASLSAGGSHTCAVAASGAAYCWGSNTYGELGTGNGVGAASTPQLVAGGHAFGSISAGRNHTCGLLSVPQFSGAAAYCWGLNADGQLGDGTTINRAAPVAVGPYTP
jgi:alpha-tubulin suppressor-like RCC1 family protein